MPEWHMIDDKNRTKELRHINKDVLIKRCHPDRCWADVFGFCVSGIVLDMAQKSRERLKELETQTSESE